MRVLLVEDEANSRDVYSRLLELDGHDVLAVGTASLAMTAIDREPFDVAMIDVALGAESGFAVLSHLRRRQPGARAVIMTAYDLADASRHAQSGADAFLAKPLQWSDVRAALAHSPSERRAS